MNSLLEAQLLLCGNTDRPVHQSYHRLLVYIVYSPMFGGLANMVNREHPNISQLLRDTQSHPLFCDTVNLIGLSKVTLWVQYGLRSGWFTSRSGLYNTVDSDTMPRDFYRTVCDSPLFAYLPRDEPVIHEIPLLHQKLIRDWMYTVAEEACWDFASPLIPHILREQQFTGPVSVEIKVWQQMFLWGESATLLTPHLDFTSFSVLTNRATLVENLFEEVRDLRNLSTHRKALTIDDILFKSQKSAELMRLLGDDTRLKFFTDLNLEICEFRESAKQMREASRISLNETLMELRGGKSHFESLEELSHGLGENEALETLKEREKAMTIEGDILAKKVMKLLKSTGSALGNIYGGSTPRTDSELGDMNSKGDAEDVACVDKEGMVSEDDESVDKEGVFSKDNETVEQDRIIETQSEPIPEKEIHTESTVNQATETRSNGSMPIPIQDSTPAVHPEQTNQVDEGSSGHEDNKSQEKVVKVSEQSFSPPHKKMQLDKQKLTAKLMELKKQTALPSAARPTELADDETPMHRIQTHLHSQPEVPALRQEIQELKSMVNAEAVRSENRFREIQELILKSMMGGSETANDFLIKQEKVDVDMAAKDGIEPASEELPANKKFKRATSDENPSDPEAEGQISKKRKVSDSLSI